MLEDLLAGWSSRLFKIISRLGMDKGLPHACNFISFIGSLLHPTGGLRNNIIIYINEGIKCLFYVLMNECIGAEYKLNITKLIT